MSDCSCELCMVDGDRVRWLRDHVTPEIVQGCDVPRLRKALEHITAHPDEWDQGVWMTGKRVDSENAVEVKSANENVCATAGCLAGTVASQAGALFSWSEYGRVVDAETVFLVGDNGEIQGREMIAGYAADKLGLPHNIGDMLWAGGNSLGQLWEMANVITGGEIEAPISVAS